MNKLTWKTNKTISIGKYKIPCARDLCDQRTWVLGIHRDSRSKFLLNPFLWPIIKWRDDLFVDGFIEYGIGKWIKQLINDNIVFIEVGCGDMSLRKFLRRKICYNAFDISLSELHLKRAFKKGNVNVALASATDIPLDSNLVSLIVSTECFEHIPEIDRAISEIRRVAKPNAKLLCTIPNNYCYKYQKKGPHPEHVNNWSYEEFKEYMNERGFKFIEGYMKGFWIPLPLWLTKTSYQLPISSKNEFYNTNFFYMFGVEK